MSDDLEPLLGQPTVFATRRFPHYPTASASLWRASTKPKEQGNTERGETAPPPRSSRQAGRPAAGKANLRDAGRSWGAADDDGFPAREEREQTEDDRARVPVEQDAGGCAFGSDSAVKSCGLGSRLVGLHRRHHRGRSARPKRFARQEPFTRRHHSRERVVNPVSGTIGEGRNSLGE
jgi:hypothetical protein